MAWCDNTDESLVFRLRPGNAGSNTAADHIAVLDEALAQIPSRHHRDVLVTVDGAGATLDLVRHLTTLNAVPGRRVHYSVGFDVDERARTAITTVPQGAWQA
ncbi:MAG: IS1380 family transposase, partial [Pseudonocardiaceae bacterium]